MEDKPPKKDYTRKSQMPQGTEWLWVAFGVLVLVGAISGLGGKDNPAPVASTEASPAREVATVTEPADEPTATRQAQPSATSSSTSTPTPIPTVAVATYVIQGGDTLGAIAAEFGLTWQEIAAANDIDDPALIRPGQQLTIPGQSGDAAIESPTQDEQPQSEATQTKAPTEQATLSSLPGLTPVDVKLSLINQLGFECGNVDHGTNYYVWVCEKSATTTSYDVKLYVEIYGKTLSTVNFIDSSVLQSNSPDDELSAMILGFIATMPYDNADPATARKWVEDQLADVGQENTERSTVINGVPFHFYGPPSARMLEIGTLQ